MQKIYFSICTESCTKQYFVNSWERTKGYNDNVISIHASGNEIKDNNVSKKEQVSNISEDHDPLSLYFSKVRSDGEEYSSNGDEWGKGRYKDLLDSVQEEMGPPQLRFEFKNILIPIKCSHLKTPYLKECSDKLLWWI